MPLCSYRTTTARSARSPARSRCSVSAGRCWSCARSCSAAAASRRSAATPESRRTSFTDRLASARRARRLERRGDEYRLTRKAIDANPVIVALLQWGDAHAAPDGPPRVLVHARCGTMPTPVLQCAHSSRRSARRAACAPGPRADERQVGDPLLPHERLTGKAARDAGTVAPVLWIVTALGLALAALAAAPAAQAQDRYALAGGCYALKSPPPARTSPRPPTAATARRGPGRGRAVPHAGDRPRPLPALRQGPRLPRQRHPAAGRQRVDLRCPGGQTPPSGSRPRTRRARPATGVNRAGDGAAAQLLEGGRVLAAGDGGRSVMRTTPASARGSPSTARRLPGVSRGRDRRERRPDPGASPGARSGLGRRPHAHDGLRVPRRARPLRAAVAPLRRRRTR